MKKWPWDVIVIAIILAVVLFNNKAHAAVTDLRLKVDQIFDVQWYISGGNLNASGFNYIYSSVNYSTQSTNTPARWTAAQTADAGSNGRYISFIASPTVAGTYGMAVFNSDGSIYKWINYTGSFRALANGAIFYNGNGMWGTLITTEAGYNYGSSGSWAVTADYPTTAQLDAYVAPAYSSAQPSTPPDPNTTVVGSSTGITAAQSTTKNAAQTRRDSYWGNNIYIDQIGDNNSITVKQESANNTLRGYAGQSAHLAGSNNTVDIRQGANGVPGNNLVELDYNGDANNIKIYQDRLNDGSQDSSAYGNHIARANVDGSNNTLSIIQRNNLTYPQGHYADVNITGTSNNVSALQISDYAKTAFINIQGNTNVVNLSQHENANHYAEIKLQGDGHNVNLEQTGTGAHKATIDLINNGASSTVNVLQQGTTPQTYSLQQTCVTSGCGATITQGQ